MMGMGPNGSGKSTLAYVLAGKDNYKVTEGEVLLNGDNILKMSPDERAAKGIFLAFQYPVEVPGVATMTFLRTALNAQRKTRGEAEVSTPEFMRPRFSPVERFINSLAITARRMWSATVTAARNIVFGRMTANSSPP